jgi:ParB family transcriptional regulator, chromosome partitioning protein
MLIQSRLERQPPRACAADMTKRKSLGRGLEALLSKQPTPAPRDSEIELRELPVDLLSRGRHQPRADMREESLQDLAESIRAQGVVQPIVVRPLPADGGGERYEIVAGERRWRAAQLAGLHKVPALVREIPDEAAIAVALIENIQRENLNPIEEAHSLQRLVEEFGLTHEQAAGAVGRSRVGVSNLLRLLELPAAVREMLARRELDMGHARALLGVPSADLLLDLAKRVVREGLSVRATEQAVRRVANSSADRMQGRPAADPNIERLQMDLGETLGAAVRIEHGAKGGRVVIRYHSLDELEGILAHIR